MPDDKPSYKQAHEARNKSRIVIEGIDEPSPNFASRVPKGYTSIDVEDRRNERVPVKENVERPAGMSKQ